MPNPGAKTEEESLRAPPSAVAPRSSWTGGGGESGTATGVAARAMAQFPLPVNPGLAPLKQIAIGSEGSGLRVPPSTI